MKYLDDLLRSNPVGVWGSMPEAEDLDWTGKPHNRGIGRIDASAMWRVGTRKEMVEHYKGVMDATYKKLFLAIGFLVGALLCFTFFTQTKDLAFALGVIACGALCSKYYTGAWGGYAGGWSDYEHDPVQVLAQNSYVLNNGFGLM